MEEKNVDGNDRKISIHSTYKYPCFDNNILLAFSWYVCRNNSAIELTRLLAIA